MNNNNQNSPFAIAVIMIFIVFSSILYAVSESIILSMIFAAGITALLSPIVLKCVDFFRKFDKETLKKYSIIICSSFAGLLIISLIVASCVSNNYQEETSSYSSSDYSSSDYSSSDYSSSSSSYKSSTSPCTYCDGEGKHLVKWYSEGDWGEVSYSSYKCNYCNGTGRR